MFYTFRFACFTKKELARMIDIIQKWILFPVQIVKCIFHLLFIALYARIETNINCESEVY